MQSPHLPLDALLAEASWLRRLALHLVGDAEVADDLVQETLTSATRAHKKIPITSPRAWLAGVLRHRAQRHHRAERHRTDRESTWTKEQPTEGEPVSAIASRMELQSVVGQELSRLDEPFRSVLFDHYYEQKSFEAIAKSLDIPAGTVRARAKRARELLRQALVERDGRAWSEWSAALAPIAGLGSVAGERAAAAVAVSKATTPGLIKIVTWAAVAAGGLAIGWASFRGPEIAPRTESSSVAAQESALPSEDVAPDASLATVAAKAPMRRESAVATQDTVATAGTLIGGGRILSNGPWTDRPLEGAYVQFIREDSDVIDARVTERNWAAMGLAPGTWTICAWAHGHAVLTQSIEVDAAGVLRHDIELTAIGAVPVRLEDADGNDLRAQYQEAGGQPDALWVWAQPSPIADTVQRPRPWHRGTPNPSAWVTRDSQEFVLPSIASRHAGELRLAIEGELNAALVFGNRVIARGVVRGGDDELVLRTDAQRLTSESCAVKQRVVDAATGAPIRGASCSLHHGALRRPLYATSDALGWVEFRLPPGSATLEIRCSGTSTTPSFSAKRDFQVKSGNPMTLDELRWPSDPSQGFGAIWSGDE